MSVFNKILFYVLILVFISCEKEITVDLPKSTQQYVVEASVNQTLATLNYVFISKSVDYFNPDLSLGGVKNATVFITEGTINGSDTNYNGTRTQLFDIATLAQPLPGADSILRGISGIYFNPFLICTEGKAYFLEITLDDGTKINGKTYIPKVVPIDTIKYTIKKEDVNHDGFNDAYVNLFFNDPPQQNNYRLATFNYTNSVLLGWGSADNFRTFDDELLNGVQRIISYTRPFAQGDTLNFYLNSIGRKEFIFWQSFNSAANNGGPFATPVLLKSNINGAIGSFTGYGCSYKQAILN
jgi:hypothetical protein